MLLAHLLHRELSARALGGTTLDEGAAIDGVALADAVVRRALALTGEAHQAIWDSLPSGKKAVLAALAEGESPTGSIAARRHDLSRATLQSALKDLGREGQHVTRGSTPAGDLGPWRYVDPLFAQWVANRGHPVGRR
jgi:hypothetical protein